MKYIIELVLLAVGVLFAGYDVLSEGRPLDWLALGMIALSCSLRTDSYLFAWMPGVASLLFHSHEPGKNLLWPHAAAWVPSIVMSASVSIWTRHRNGSWRLYTQPMLHVFLSLVASGLLSLARASDSMGLPRLIRRVVLPALLVAIIVPLLRSLVLFGRGTRHGSAGPLPPRDRVTSALLIRMAKRARHDARTSATWDSAHLLLLSQAAVAAAGCWDVLSQRVRLAADWADWREGGSVPGGPTPYHLAGNSEGVAGAGEMGGHAGQDERMAGAGAALLLAAGLACAAALGARWAGAARPLVGCIALTSGLLGAEVLSSWWLGEEALAWAIRALLFPLAHQGAAHDSASRSGSAGALHPHALHPVDPGAPASMLRWRRPVLLAAWLLAVGLLVLAGQQAVQGGCMARIVARKIFHGVASACIAAGWWFDRPLAQLALSSALLACALVEACRWTGLLGRRATRAIDAALLPLADARDASGIILSHVYLLVGCSSPVLLLAALQGAGVRGHEPRLQLDGLAMVWGVPASEHSWALGGWRGSRASFVAAAQELLPMAGVLAVGIGDAAAAAVGSTVGRLKLPFGGAPKTLEGTVACAVSVALSSAAWLWLSCVGAPGWGALGLCSLLGVWLALLEAYCAGVDNIGLPIAAATLLAAVASSSDLAAS